MTQPLVVAFGGGKNSGAMIAGFYERNVHPDLILFADTGGELPATYDYIRHMDRLCYVLWGVPITTVYKTYQGEFETLEDNCLRKNMLPSLAYGRKACSIKFKVDPQQMHIFHWMKEKGLHRVTQAVGYDAGEVHRRHDIKTQEIRRNRFVDLWYPLMEWGWDRDRCVDEIMRLGMPVPPKSSCFFCPARKRPEILKLKADHPMFFKRALAIEANAHLTSPGRGLGGSGRRWADEDTRDEERKKLLEWVDDHAPQQIPCGCYDG